jgi:hypothetical protein
LSIGQRAILPARPYPGRTSKAQAILRKSGQPPGCPLFLHCFDGQAAQHHQFVKKARHNEDGIGILSA